jgi:hypothetical protein
MDIDLDLYRHEVRVSTNPLVWLSAIDISPESPLIILNALTVQEVVATDSAAKRHNGNIRCRSSR